jgi:hypothetical protein
MMLVSLMCRNRAIYCSNSLQRLARLNICMKLLEEIACSLMYLASIGELLQRCPAVYLGTKQ